MDMSKLRGEPPVTPEEVFSAICEEYDTRNNCHPNNNNSLLLRYIMNPVNLDHLKKLIRRIHNDPYKQEYILDRLLNFSKELNRLSNLAELYEKEARTCRQVLITSGSTCLVAGGGVVAKATVAKTATVIGLDLLGTGGILTAAGLATSYFVVKHNKNKIDLREPIGNATRILSRLNELR